MVIKRKNIFYFFLYGIGQIVNIKIIRVKRGAVHFGGFTDIRNGDLGDRNESIWDFCCFRSNKRTAHKTIQNRMRQTAAASCFDCANMIFIEAA